MSNVTAMVRTPTQSLEFSEEQMEMIRKSYANGAEQDEFRVLMEIAKARNLNPLFRQIFFVKRGGGGNQKGVWSAQVSIDGLRAIAQRTGLYDGQDEPEFEHDKEGWPILAKVKVYRKDWARPAVGIAYFKEYAVTTQNGLTQMWNTKPHVMIAKCAESLALRKAFPEDTGGLYTAEEMGGDTADDTVSPMKPVAPALVIDRSESQEVPSRLEQELQASIGVNQAKADTAVRDLEAKIKATTTIKELEGLTAEITRLPKGAVDRLRDVYKDQLALLKPSPTVGV